MRYWLALLVAVGTLANANVHKQPAVVRPHAAAVTAAANHALAGTITRNINTGGLKGDCVARIIAQKGNPLCKQTCAPNFTPQYDGSCACNAPYKLNGDVCSPVCTNGFSLSLDKTACVCSPRKFTSADGTTCSYTCPAGQFGGSNRACTPCGANAKTCRNVNTATSCNAGFFLYQGNCVAQCPLQNYADSKKVCSACADSDASSCTDGGAKSATACMTKYLVEGQCLDGDSLPNGYYADPTTHTAKQCAPGVKSCTCGDANCATACGLDSNSNQLYLNFDGTCVAQCSSGSYNDPHTDACLKCDSTALTCDVNGALICGKDSLGTQLYLTLTKKCILAAAGVAGYWPDDATNTFLPCLDGVTTCVGGGVNDALTCGTRSDGTTLYFNGYRPDRRSARLARRRSYLTGACVEAASCPPATWADAITNVCTECDIDETACKGNGAGQALACEAGNYLSTSGDCLNADQCTSSGAFWPDSTNNACSACDAGEAACTGNGAGLATACATNVDGKQLFLFNGDCYISDACPAGTYPDSDSKTCAACDAGALTCTGPHAALTCGTTSTGARLYLNIDGNCVSSQDCDSTTWADPATQVCEPCTLNDPDAKTCSSPFTMTCATKFFFNGACIDTCPAGFFADANTHTCTRCTDPFALTCDATGSLTCVGPWFLVDGHCAPICPDGTYPNGAICSSCTDLFGSSAATCTATEPLSCNPGFVFAPTAPTDPPVCIPDAVCNQHGYYPNNGFCTLCSDTWAFATECTASGPTACLIGTNLDPEANACINCPPGTTFDSVTLTCEAANFCPAGFYDAATQDFARGFYTNGQGICEPCVDIYAITCSSPYGYTTQCVYDFTRDPAHACGYYDN